MLCFDVLFLYSVLSLCPHECLHTLVTLLSDDFPFTFFLVIRRWEEEMNERISRFCFIVSRVFLWERMHESGIWCILPDINIGIFMLLLVPLNYYIVFEVRNYVDNVMWLYVVCYICIRLSLCTCIYLLNWLGAYWV